LAAANLETLERVEVSYVILPGWRMSIAAVSSYEDLPENCKKYITFIEEYLKVPIEWIGVGPERGNMIRK
jgi:adenylosuccinate synthase